MLLAMLFSQLFGQPAALYDAYLVAGVLGVLLTLVGMAFRLGGKISALAATLSGRSERLREIGETLRGLPCGGCAWHGRPPRQADPDQRSAAL